MRNVPSLLRFRAKYLLPMVPDSQNHNDSRGHQKLADCDQGKNLFRMHGLVQQRKQVFNLPQKIRDAISITDVVFKWAECPNH